MKITFPTRISGSTDGSNRKSMVKTEPHHLRSTDGSNRHSGVKIKPHPLKMIIPTLNFDEDFWARKDTTGVYYYPIGFELEDSRKIYTVR